MTPCRNTPVESNEPVPECDNNSNDGDEVESVASNTIASIAQDHNYAADWDSYDESDNDSVTDTIEEVDADDEIEEEDESEPEDNDIMLSVYLGNALRRYININQLSDIVFEENGPTQIIASNLFSPQMQVPAEGVVYVISDPDTFDDIFPEGSDSDSGYGARSQPSSLLTTNSEASDSGRSERGLDRTRSMLHRAVLVFSESDHETETDTD